MANVQVTTDELWRQAAEQLDPIEGLSAIETQSDIALYALNSLIIDIQNYAGTGKVTLSTNTTNALAAIKSVQAQASIGDTDVATPSTSVNIQALISIKTFSRQLQKTYYALKKTLGLS
jgi:hypothetical protein